MQVMMFALLQEQHQLQLELMVAANKAIMESMMEQINALVAAHRGRKPLAAIEHSFPEKQRQGKWQGHQNEGYQMQNDPVPPL
jgi:hypothetical protein